MANLNPCAQQKRKSQGTKPHGNIPPCLQLGFEDVICLVAFLLLLQYSRVALVFFLCDKSLK